MIGKVEMSTVQGGVSDLDDFTLDTGSMVRDEERLPIQGDAILEARRK